MADDGFFSRWSRRKAEARPAVAPAQAAVVSPPSVDPIHPVARRQVGVAEVALPPNHAHAAEPSLCGESMPAPTLADVAQLTPEGDFSRFVARNVVPQVRNAAMKKLFADPHFNVMDGLDIYIDDYSIASPLEPELVAEMLSSPFFSPPKPLEQTSNSAEQALADDSHGDMADRPVDPEPEPATDASILPPSSPPLPHDHADLQLQPDPATGPEGSGSGTG